MFFSPISYDEPLFRPPAEAVSHIIQATIGCSWNKCAFCEMYKQKKFHLRKEQDVLKDIETLSQYDPGVKKFFIADGNAFVMSANKLLTICNHIKNRFRQVQRISAYALPSDILSKTDNELKHLKEAGLDLLYVGIESGDDELLQLVNKGETFQSTLDGLQKAKKAGIRLSVMILNGLGGAKYSRQHAIHSAKITNEINPEFLSLLVLNMPLGRNHFLQQFKGDFQPMSLRQLAEEIRLFIAETVLKNSIFRSDHVSNYLVMKGILGRDKEKLLGQLDNFIGQAEKDADYFDRPFL
jgi:radical SAM superfamily enzyme YgiQ (UPF0313 family)